MQVTPAPVTDIQFVKPKHSNKRGQPTTQDSLQLIQPQKKWISGDTGPHQHPQNSKEDLYNSLHDLVPNACLFTIVSKPHQQAHLDLPPTIQENTNSSPSPGCSQPAHTNTHVSPPHPSENLCPSPSTIQKVSAGGCNMLPLPLTELFSKEFQALSGQPLLEKAKEVFQCMTISTHESALVEKATRNQRECTEWYRQREGRLTASSFHDVFVRKNQSDPVALVKKLLTRKSLTFVPAIKWGIDSEDIARQDYVHKMKASHQDFECTQAGLVINPFYPHLGASPDGFTQCHCCGQGILEIKCPFSGKECHPNDLKGKKGFFLYQHGLIQSNRYYTQVQGQLMVCEKDFCDFVVWTPKGIFIQRIFMDSAFRERLIKKLTTFYVEQFLPELMTRHLQCAASANTNVYCFCQKEEHGKMIQCENPTCKYGWFHFSCIDLKRPPKGSWYCPECNS